MSSLLNVVDSVAGSPNIQAKVATQMFLDMWRDQFRSNPSVRDIFDRQTAEDIKVQRGDLDLPDTDVSSLPKIDMPVPADTEQPNSDTKQDARDRKSEQAEKERDMKKAENDGDDPIRGLLG